MNESIVLSKEGYDFIKLYKDKTIENLKTGHIYNQKLGNDASLVVWKNGKSVEVPIMRFWRKYFANEILDVPITERQDLTPFGFANYVITKDGRVWNKYFYNWQKPNFNKSTGYVDIKLTNHQGLASSFKLHRLLMSVFNPCSNAAKMEIDHINGDKTDNRLDNLEWVTTEENGRRARENGLHRRTLTDEQIHAFCKEWTTGKYKTAGQCARALGLVVTACEHIINHVSHTRIASLYGIPYKKPVRLTPVDWSRYPKSKYLKRPTTEQSVACTPSNCEKRLRAEQPQT